MRLRINLATRRYINLRAINLAIALGFAVLGALLLFQVQRLAYNAGELKRLQQGIAARAALPKEHAEVVGEAQYAALTARIRFANDALAKKSVKWLTLLDSLEEVIPEGVALSSIQPDLRKQTVVISGIARTFTNLRSFLENMERSSRFSDVYLLSESETKVGSTQQGVTFNLSCKVPLQ